jgi:hypothetical protein
MRKFNNYCLLFPDPALRRVIVVFAVPPIVYAALWMDVVIYSQRTRPCRWKMGRRLSYLWTYLTFRVSFRKHTAFKYSTALVGTRTNVTDSCRLMAGRQEVNSSFLHRRKFLLIVGSRGVTLQHVRVSTESYS